MSKSSCHCKQVSGTWQWVDCTPTVSTVTRSTSNRAPSGCGGHLYSNCVTLLCQYGSKSLRNVSNLLRLSHEESKQFQRQTWAQPFTSKVMPSFCLVGHKTWHESELTFWVYSVKGCALDEQDKNNTDATMISHKNLLKGLIPCCAQIYNRNEKSSLIVC